LVEIPGAIVAAAEVQSGLIAVVVFVPPVPAISRVDCKLDEIVYGFESVMPPVLVSVYVYVMVRSAGVTVVLFCVTVRLKRAPEYVMTVKLAGLDVIVWAPNLAAPVPVLITDPAVSSSGTMSYVPVQVFVAAGAILAGSAQVIGVLLSVTVNGDVSVTLPVFVSV